MLFRSPLFCEIRQLAITFPDPAAHGRKPAGGIPDLRFRIPQLERKTVAAAKILANGLLQGTDPLPDTGQVGLRILLVSAHGTGQKDGQQRNGQETAHAKAGTSGTRDGNRRVTVRRAR